MTHPRNPKIALPILIFFEYYGERVVDRLPLMIYGLKLSFEALILKFKKKSFNNLRFNELQLNFGNSNFFCKA